METLWGAVPPPLELLELELEELEELELEELDELEPPLLPTPIFALALPLPFQDSVSMIW